MSRIATAGLVLLVIGISGCVQPASALFGLDGASLPEALLLADPYPDLIVEVDHVDGREPCVTTIQTLQSNLRFLTDKRQVLFAQGEPIEPRGGDYDNGDLVAIHKKEADHGPTGAGSHGQGEAAHLHILFLDGNAASKNGGHAAGRTIYDYGVIYIFKDSFDHAYDGASGADATCEVERTVMLHELGHALGIVNRGVPMLTDRESDDHPGHSENPESAMYPLVRFDTDGRILGKLPSSFDAEDIADIVAYREANA